MLPFSLLVPQDDFNKLGGALTLEKCLLGTLHVRPPDLKTFLKKSPSRSLATLKSLSLTSDGNGEKWSFAISSSKLRRLHKICPMILEVSLDSFNLVVPNRRRRPKLGDFPVQLRLLSLRNCVLDLKTLLSGVTKGCDVVTLDFGRCCFVNKRGAPSHDLLWPHFRLLRELYLEGCPFFNSSLLLDDVLRACPSLRVLDIEGTSTNGYLVLEAIGKNLPHLRELYVGWTDVKDSYLLALPKGHLANLTAVCLAGTSVTGVGAQALSKACPRLKTLRISRVRFGKAAARHLEMCLEMKVHVEWHWSDNVFSLLTHEGCEHFRERANQVVTA